LTNAKLNLENTTIRGAGTDQTKESGVKLDSNAANLDESLISNSVFKDLNGGIQVDDSDKVEISDSSFDNIIEEAIHIYADSQTVDGFSINNNTIADSHIGVLLEEPVGGGVANLPTLTRMRL
jgi:hypothetical protein